MDRVGRHRRRRRMADDERVVGHAPRGAPTRRSRCGHAGMYSSTGKRCILANAGCTDSTISLRPSSARRCRSAAGRSPGRSASGTNSGFRLRRAGDEGYRTRPPPCPSPRAAASTRCACPPASARSTAPGSAAPPPALEVVPRVVQAARGRRLGEFGQSRCGPGGPDHLPAADAGKNGESPRHSASTSASSRRSASIQVTRQSIPASRRRGSKARNSRTSAAACALNAERPPAATDRSGSCRALRLARSGRLRGTGRAGTRTRARTAHAPRARACRPRAPATHHDQGSRERQRAHPGPSNRVT